MTSFLSSQVMAAEHCNTVWRIRNAPPEITVKDLLKPDTWAHSAQKFAQYDEVIVVPQGAPYRAHLLVMEAGKNFAKMRLLGVAELNGQTDQAEDTALGDGSPVGVKWNGPRHKFVVYRRSDNEVLKFGFAVKADAEDWARNHANLMAA